MLKKQRIYVLRLWEVALITNRRTFQKDIRQQSWLPQRLKIEDFSVISYLLLFRAPAAPAAIFRRPGSTVPGRGGGWAGLARIGFLRER